MSLYLTGGVALAYAAGVVTVHRVTVSRRRALDRRMECGIEAQRKRLFQNARHRPRLLVERTGVHDRLRFAFPAENNHQV